MPQELDVHLHDELPGGVPAIWVIRQQETTLHLRRHLDPGLEAHLIAQSLASRGESERSS